MNYKTRLAHTFAYSNLDEEEIQRRSILILLVGLTSFFGLIYSFIYVFLGVSKAMTAIMFYIGFSIVNLLVYYLTKKYNLFRSAQLIGILLFPTLTHILNGGFDQSSVVVLAAMLSPLGALMFHTPKTARLFFFFFIAVVFISTVVDIFYPLQRIEIPNQIRMVFYFFNIAIITSISFFLLLKFVSDNERFKSILKIKNRELTNEKIKVEKALNDLQLTQKQLIHNEKMASLGELTAGIAHEIQNPLNFVNNFSEVSHELIDELKEEMEKGNQKAINEILQDITGNLEKITHHGKRAEGIVKSMLQHSRGSTGQKKLTDLNTLADECLRLSYHGLRAKDKSFNADFKLHADEALPELNIIPQDIGRVLLNLINNAFYACTERSRNAVNEASAKSDDGFRPSVIVSTKKLGNKLEIRVKDNGTGIPDNVKDKIFQPFFTTKPTGQGTGLGLSLSYDIITKGHNGSITCNSKQDEGTEFIVSLPLDNIKN
ncbi:sensor histidine kinase [Saccharicrinis sp. FJH2]|uniref:sensor histidine kinase n=1 Tax=Saccharicrinis sp. FJH65 TaxID=3344659 RepID=UPI0035F36CA9